MNLPLLESKRRLTWTVQSIAETFGISEASARVMCARYTKRGYLLRLRQNLYVPASTADRMDTQELFRLSNLVQTPSYISFGTALSHYGISTQIPRDAVECVSLTRTKNTMAGPLMFDYRKIKKELYFGFERVNGFFIATPEKALMDCLYFQSLGAYHLDVSSIDLKAFDRKELMKTAKRFPEKARSQLSSLLT